MPTGRAQAQSRAPRGAGPAPLTRGLSALSGWPASRNSGSRAAQGAGELLLTSVYRNGRGGRWEFTAGVEHMRRLPRLAATAWSLAGQGTQNQGSVITHSVLLFSLSGLCALVRLM